MMKYFITVIVFIININLFSQKLAVIGDFRGGNINAYNVSLLVKSWNPDFIVTSGDNFRPAEGTIDFQIGQFYNEFIAPYYGSYGTGDTVNRFFPALGNHDLEDSGLTVYTNYFTLPGNERYYDFVKGYIHFFILNSNPSEVDSITSNSVQANWLMNAMLNSNSRYNIVILHHSPFSSGAHGCNSTLQWNYKLWGASAVISGHDHNYERLFIDSLSYFVCGASGSPLYTTFYNYPGTQKFYSDNFGAMLINAYADSMILSYYNINDSLIDYFKIPPILSNINGINNDNINSFNILQNPFYDNLSLQIILTKNSEVTISLFNNVGNLIKKIPLEYYTKGEHKIEITTKDLKNGLYNIVITTNKKSFSLKGLKM